MEKVIKEISNEKIVTTEEALMSAMDKHGIDPETAQLVINELK